MSAAEEKKIRDTLMAEANGHLPTAFALACARLKVAIHASSWAYMRRMDPAADKLKLDDQPPVDDDSWLRTGRETP